MGFKFWRLKLFLRFWLPRKRAKKIFYRNLALIKKNWKLQAKCYTWRFEKSFEKKKKKGWWHNIQLLERGLTPATSPMKYLSTLFCNEVHISRGFSWQRRRCNVKGNMPRRPGLFNIFFSLFFFFFFFLPAITHDVIIRREQQICAQLKHINTAAAALRREYSLRFPWGDHDGLSRATTMCLSQIYCTQQRTRIAWQQGERSTRARRQQRMLTWFQARNPENDHPAASSKTTFCFCQIIVFLAITLF
jgi:hypothetical protein